MPEEAGPTVELEPADGAMDYVEARLSAAGLPTADLGSTPATFYVGTVDGRRVGVGGLERYGPDALLRSLVVEADIRGSGVGTALCGALESAAAAAGVRSLYLLTADAEAFFAAHGYVPVDRAAVPEAIRHTAEFTDLCPATATCMHKPI